ncbi:hypothetical protein [Sinomicrobium sp. M5D2P17]
MRRLLNKILPANDNKRKWVAIGITSLISGLFTVWGIYGFQQYGFALFILIPVFIGFGSSVLYGLKHKLTYIQSYQIGFLTLGVYLLGLVVFAIEGLICIVMLLPLGLLLTWAGSSIGYALLKKIPNKAPTTLMILTGLIPITNFVEKDTKPDVSEVVSSIEIQADIQTVWSNVIEFPQLDDPTEFIFKTGIAYPVNAKIDGTGIGAIRHCNFTTGSFIEPITVWDQPELLKFDVLEQPEPMEELSFWNVDAPHLHDYFVSRQGQFKLTELPNGNTLLEGTTWYYHNIRPEFYWRLWSNYIVHKIHNRVLEHIKKNAEHETK